MTSQRLVVAGADTHSQTHHVAVLDAASGQLLGDRQFPATLDGYRAIIAFVAGLGRLLRFGVEGTNSYGCGLTRHLQAAGVQVREVIRPNRAARRLRGKSDPLDAITAAQVALADDDLPVPKSSDGPVESIRVLAMVRDSAVKDRATVLRQIAMILVSAPAAQREKLQKLGLKALVDTLRHCRPANPLQGVEAATTTALRRLARRHEYLSEEIEETTEQLRALIEHVNPALLAAQGVGVVTAAQLLITAGDNPHRITGKAAFAALTGVSPIPASSGKTNRHRLNRGGDRQANKAIHTIALVRMSMDPRSKTYITKRSPRARRNAKRSAASNATSPTRSSRSSRTHPPSPTSPTCAPHASHAGSPCKPSPTTSASGPTTSPPSNAANAATTTSPTATANGSPPLDNP